MDKYRFNFFCQGCTKGEVFCETNCLTKFKKRTFQKGDYIAYKGDVTNSLALLVKGEVAISTVLDTGLVLITRFHKAPTPFGMVALFSARNHYRVDIQAKSVCEIIYISKEEIERTIEKCRTFMRNFMAHTSKMVDIYAAHLNVLTFSRLNARLAYYILIHSEDNKFTFPHKIADVASYLCVERPSLSRAIAQLVREKIISYNKGGGEILDVMALRNML